MGVYIESGIGSANDGSAAEIGRKAALQAISQIQKFKPSLALVFVSSEVDIEEVNRGVVEILGDCPLIGTSTAGEIANGLIRHGAVVAVLASLHLRARVGMGKGVSKDFRIAAQDALTQAGASEYFNQGHPLHQMLHVSASGMPGISPVFLIVFSPGATKTQASLSHEIQTFLRSTSANRIPIFGGSSGDYLHFESNYQIKNEIVSGDAVALAFVETETLFGMGMAHGFSPTTKHALVTRATGHIVQELDRRPAAEVCANLLEIPMEELGEGAVWFSRFPFGSIDIYGNSILHVPERILEDGSIQFGPIMKSGQLLTLMRGAAEEVSEATAEAYEKAIRHGGLTKPVLTLLFSCALRPRLMGDSGEKEIELVCRKAGIPVCGYYTFGEKGLSDDGLPIYSNHSITTLVFSDELNPVASLISKGEISYREFTSRLASKASQIRSINRINQIIQDGTDVGRLLTSLSDELPMLFPWAKGAFYLPTGQEGHFSVFGLPALGEFPQEVRIQDKLSEYIPTMLESHGKCFGLLLLKLIRRVPLPDEEDIALADTVGKLTAGGLYRLELDGLLDLRLQQLEILNQIGHELSKPISPISQSQNIVRHIRHILNLSFASLWLVDRTHRLLVKEAVNARPEMEIGKLEYENDERITRWQIEHQEPLFFTSSTTEPSPIPLERPFSFSFVSLPVLYKHQLKGVLNLYSHQRYRWSFQHERMFENMEFLQSISTQIAIFIENRSLHKHAVFNKEIHHRVKNNLQSVASLLRMQMRRLDSVPAEQALSESIARIMSIALVHETLSHEEIGGVDLGRLIGSVSKISDPNPQQGPIITLDSSGPPLFVPSREATSLALVVNELIQNAVKHGQPQEGRGSISLKIAKLNGSVSVEIKDNGPGLRKGFDPDRHANLGLTIVRTIVKDDLKGQFYIGSEEGTIARVSFPLSEGYHPIE
jgi:two-component sensor histidine kinase